MSPEFFAVLPSLQEVEPPVRRVPAEQGGEPEVPLPCLFGTTQTKRPPVSCARKAETLFQNLSALIERRGLACVGFTTLTFVENLTDRPEAQRRFNSLATGFFRRIELLEWIAAVERQGRGALHYHLAIAFPWDIRTGFDFKACSEANVARKAGNLAEFKRLERVYFASANPALRAWWSDLRTAAGKYGFGRCETLPVLSNAAGVARYVGSYVGKEFAGREARDKGLRTIRYSLDERPWASRWSFSAGGQQQWRKGCSVLAALLQTDDLTSALGKRWAWHWREPIAAYGRHWEDCLRAVSEVSDNYDFEERLVRASRLFGSIITHEKEHPNEA